MSIFNIEFPIFFYQLLGSPIMLFLCRLLVVATVVTASILPQSDPLASCPGYKASNVKTTTSSLTADLSLAGAACNVYGSDLTNLTLEVVYETGEFLLSHGDLESNS